MDLNSHDNDAHAQIAPETADTMSREERSELDRLGIERVQTEAFLWGGFRYSNARDALAAAKRGEKA